MAGMKNARTSNVVINFNVRYQAARDMIAGIMRFAAAHPDWSLQIRGNHPSNDGFKIGDCARIDGLISGYDLNRRDEAGQDEVRALFRKGSGLKAAVMMSVPIFRSPHVPVSLVEIDHKALAATAAQLFLRHGLKNFAFIGSPVDEVWSNARRDAYRDILAGLGHRVDEFQSPSTAKGINWASEVTALKTWLRHLPKPCGLFAAYDQRAKHVIDTCRAEGIDIPKEIQVLGVDNEDCICELTTPSLSSIGPDFEGAGYRAAQELDRLMRGSKARKNAIFIRNNTLTERQSTSDLSRTGERVTRALEFIRMHATERIGVAEVAHAIGGSVRLIEKDFRRIVGRTICAEIQEARLQAVAKALQSTSNTLADIARHSGLGCETYLKTLFRRRFGMTMSAYRQSKGILRPNPVMATQI